MTCVRFVSYVRSHCRGGCLEVFSSHARMTSRHLSRLWAAAVAVHVRTISDDGWRRGLCPFSGRCGRSVRGLCSSRSQVTPRLSAFGVRVRPISGRRRIVLIIMSTGPSRPPSGSLVSLSHPCFDLRAVEFPLKAASVHVRVAAVWSVMSKARVGGRPRRVHQTFHAQAAPSIASNPRCGDVALHRCS